MPLKLTLADSDTSTTDLHQHLSKVMDACYSATIAASQAMVANKSVFDAYIQRRKETTKGMVRGAAGVFTGTINAGVCCHAVPASFTHVSVTRAAAATASLAKWPSLPLRI